MDIEEISLELKEDNQNESKNDIKKQKDNQNPTLPKKSKWGLVRNVVRAISLFKTQEVETISVDELIDGIRQIPTDKVYQLHRRRSRENSAYVVAINDLRRESTFGECVERGNPNDLKIMQALMSDDPYKLLRDSTHPLALINKRNVKGQTPLYVACKNGNLEVVLQLISVKADHRLTSLIDREEETCLEVAVRWGHNKIVQELLKLDWPKKCLEKARKLASTQEMQGCFKKSKSKCGCFCIPIKH